MATICEYAAKLKQGESGRRFLDLYEFRQQNPPTTAVRIGLWAMAVVLIVGGAAIGWLQGLAASSPSSAWRSSRWSSAPWP